MNIETVTIDGFKGLRLTADVGGRNLLLVGPTGSGKSTVIDAIRLAMALPCGFSTQRIQRLGVGTGIFRVTIKTRGRVFSRSVTPAKVVHSVNGAAMSEAEYTRAAREVIDVTPEQMDLSAFLALSGQKRAELFARMTSSDMVDLSVALMAATGTGSLDAYAQSVHEEAEPGVCKITDEPRSPAGHADAARQEVNAAQSAERDARTHYEKVNAQPAPATADNLDQIAAEKQELDVELGALDQCKQAFERDCEAHGAVAKVLEGVDAQIAANRTQRARLQQALDQEPALARKLEEEIADHRAAINAELAAFEAHAATEEPLASALERSTAADAAAQALSRMTALSPTSPAVERAIKTVAGQHPGQEELAVRLVSAFLRAFPDALKTERQSAVAEAIAAKAAHEAARRARQIEEQSLSTAQTWVARAESNRNAADKALRECRAKAPLLSECDTEHDALQQRRLELAEQLQRVGANDDLAAIEAQREQLTDRRERLAQRRQAAERAKAYAGQLEEARLAVARAGVRTAVAKALHAALQEWRDKQAQAALERLHGPLARRLSEAFGRPIALEFRGEGTGRSTVFDVLVGIRGRRVSIEDVSTGEMVLIGAAFLATLQERKTTPGRLLTLNAESLDQASVRPFLDAVPRLGVDTCVVAIHDDSVPAEVRGRNGEWCVVDVAQAERLA